MEVFNTTRPFVTGQSQAVRIPEKYRFADDEELVINRIGESIIITPKRALASSFFSGASQLGEKYQ